MLGIELQLGEESEVIIQHARKKKKRPVTNKEQREHTVGNSARGSRNLLEEKKDGRSKVWMGKHFLDRR